MEEDCDILNKDGGNKKEDKKGSSEKLLSNSEGFAEIKDKVGMAKMEGMFIAIEQLAPSSNITANEASQATANKPIYDVDGLGTILLDSAEQLLKPTALNNLIDIRKRYMVKQQLNDEKTHNTVH